MEKGVSPSCCTHYMSIAASRQANLPAIRQTCIKSPHIQPQDSAVKYRCNLVLKMRSTPVDSDHGKSLREGIEHMSKKLLLLAMVIFIATVGSAHAGNILLNGSFESGLANWTVGGSNTGYPPAVIITNGINGSAFGEAIPADTIVGGSPDAAGSYGVYFVDDRATQTLGQSVYLDVGSYEIGFDAYLPRNGYNNAGDATFNGTIAGITLANFSVKSNALPIAEWVHFSGLASVVNASFYDAAFAFQTFGNASADVVIDRAYIIASDRDGGTPINAVPDPPSLLLLSTGLGGIGLAAFRKRK